MEVSMEQEMWRFRYKKGPAPMEGFVKASSKEKAWEVAQVWCAKARVMGPLGDVSPMVVADEGILGYGGAKEPEVPAAQAEAVERGYRK